MPLPPVRLPAALAAPAAALAGGLRGATVGTLDTLRGRGRRDLRRLREEGRGGEVAALTTADGVRLHVETDGPADAAATVVFVHGFTLDLTNFREQRRALAGSGLRLVHYDQRAFGRSGRGARRGTMRLLAADLAAVVEELTDGPVVLVGHSMGVMVVTALAGLRPDLFGSRVAGTVLVAGNAGEITASEFGMGAALGPVLQLVGLRGLRALGRGPRVEPWVPAGLWTGIAGMFMCDATASPEVLRVCAALISQNGADVLAEYADAMYAHDELAALPVLARVPCAVLAAEHDRFIPEELTELLAREVTGATLTVVPSCGHMIPLEHPQVVTDAVLELAGHAARAARAG